MNSNNKYKKLYEDDYHELLTKIATATYVDYLGECIETKRKELMNLPEYKIPDEGLLKFKKDLLNVKKNKPFLAFVSYFSNISRRVAIFICIIFAGLTLSVTNIEAFKVPLLNFFIHTTESYTNIKINKYTSAPKLPAEWDNHFYPHYIPEGFEITKASFNNTTGKIIYKNENNNVILYTLYINNYTDSQDLFIDTENATTKDIVINNSPSKILFKDNLYTILLNNGTSLFTLSSNLSENELIAIAESISQD